MVSGGYRNVTIPWKGLLVQVSGCGFIRLPKRLRIHYGNIGSDWLGATIVQIECPHIIHGFPANLTTKDEKLGTDHLRGKVTTTARPGTIDHNAGPLSRF